MGGNLFVIREDESLVELALADYDSERVLQVLLAKYPRLIAGGEIDSAAPRRWLLVAQEVGLPGEEAGGDRWYVDHLLLDQDGIPTLVEVKRSSDTRIRREVVGQMLDYAANAVSHWPVERIQSVFESRCGRDGKDPGTELQAVLGPAGDPAAFWLAVKTNLQAGRVRLIFVADVIPRELARVIEFLNEQMDPAEVLGVEIRQFVGPGMKTLAPRVIGQTERSELRRSATARESRQWDEASFFAALTERHGAETAAAVRRVSEWARLKGARLAFGRGLQDGSMYPIWDAAGEWYCPIVFYTYGAVEVQFQYLKQRPPFDREDLRQEMLQHLNRIGGVSIAEARLSSRPSFRTDLLRDAQAEARLIEVLDWFIGHLPATS